MSGKTREGLADRVEALWWESKSETRKCLRCDRKFQSLSKANRICEPCKKANDREVDWPEHYEIDL